MDKLIEVASIMAICDGRLKEVRWLKQSECFMYRFDARKLNIQKIRENDFLDELYGDVFDTIRDADDLNEIYIAMNDDTKSMLLDFIEKAINVSNAIKKNVDMLMKIKHLIEKQSPRKAFR